MSDPLNVRDPQALYWEMKRMVVLQDEGALRRMSQAEYDRAWGRRDEAVEAATLPEDHWGHLARWVTMEAEKLPVSGGMLQGFERLRRSGR